MKYKLKMMQSKQEYRLTELAYESKLRNLRVDIHLAKVTEGKETKHLSLMDKIYSGLYNTRTTQLISIKCEEVTEKKYNELKRELEEAN